MGSSPLARGLLVQPRREGLGLGIIPARAGFTARCTVVHETTPDHPRSRGVYSWRRSRCRAPQGSSPLARGLQQKVVPGRTAVRIIPARAGFTPTPGPSCSPGRDHPRSRGVYPRRRRREHDPLGSSPLARGLRARRRPEPDHGGIIPARAGFTRMGRPAAAAGTDHPRSRGVYTMGALRRARRAGSSPLARGLPTVLARRAAGNRIIPARAGFTGPRVLRPWWPPDHPRSRGVYAGIGRDRAGYAGSSPLARGLPVDGEHGEVLLRIIPARAGFT